MAILKRKDGSIIAEDANKTIRQLIEKNKADLQYANCRGANFQYADCQGANCRDANCRDANFQYANFQGADFQYANCRDADFQYANFQGANFQGANCRDADFQCANFQGAIFQDADFQGADCRGAKIEFYSFPSIRLISSMNLGILSSKLSRELMRWDASMHPYPEKFNDWAKEGNCPYQNEERLFYFTTRKKDWQEGIPTMNWVELCKAICKEEGWKIRGVEL